MFTLDYPMIRLRIPKALLTVFILSCSFVYGMESTIEVRVGAFFPTSKRFRDCYKDVGATYEIEYSFSCDPCCYAWWGNLGYFHDKAFVSTNDCSSVLGVCSACTFVRPTSTIDIANLSLGIKFPYYFSECVVGYFGIGPVIGNVWLKNKDSLGDTERTSKVAYGGVAKLGVDYYITQCVFLDFFVDYLYETVDFGDHVNIGGFKTGVGLGFRF